MMPGTAMKTVFSKVGIDQIAWNPIFGIVFFTSLGLMEGKSTDEIQTKIKNDLPTAVTGSWAYWVPAHFVNFRFIPGEQRLLYINCMQIMYNIFLSFLGNRDAPETVAEKKE
jgi:protein Mpv17